MDVGQKKDEQVTLNEKQHSLVGFHEELGQLFDVFRQEGERQEKDCTERAKLKKDDLSFFLEMPFSFENTLYCAVEEDKHNKNSLNKIKKVDDNESDIEYYNRAMFVLSKQLHFFISAVRKICQNNIDDIVVDTFDNIDAVKAAFIWLHVDVHDFRNTNIQDRNKIIDLIKTQIFNLSYKTGQALQFEKRNRLKANVLNELQSKEVEYLRKKLLDYKNYARDYINKMFIVYRKLDNYLKFALSTEIEGIKKIVGSRKRIDEMVLLSEALRQSLLKYFMTYSKVDKLNSPHSILSNADFNHSDFSGGSYINATVRFSNLTNSVWRDCDLSICDFTSSDASNGDFRGSNFNYANLIGVAFKNTNLQDCQLNSVLLRSPRMDAQTEEDINNISALIGKTELSEWRDDIKIALERLGGFEALLAIKDKLKNKKRQMDDILERIKKEQDVIDDYYNGAKIRQSFLSKLDIKRDNESLFLKTTTVADGDNIITLFSDHSATETTVMDVPFNELKSLLADFNVIHNAKVISPAFRKMLLVAEKYENSEYKEERIKNSGELTFTRAGFQKANLSGAVIPNADLNHIDFSSATLDKADLNNSQFYYTDLTQASCVATDFSKSEFFNVDFTGASLAKSNFIQSVLIDCNLSDVNLSGALALGTIFIRLLQNDEQVEHYKKPYLNYILKNGGRREKSKFDFINEEKRLDNQGRDMQGVNFTGTVGNGAAFVNIVLDKSRFDNADFKTAKFFNCLVRWAFLNNCDLTYAAIIGTAFQQSQMNNLTLSQARLYATEFSGAQLNNANIISALIQKSIFRGTEVLGANFSNTLFQNCIFEDINFENVNFTNSEFCNVIFSKSSFKNCKGFDAVKFTDCVFDNCRDEKGKIGTGGDESVSTITVVYNSAEDPKKLNKTDKKTSIGGTEFDLYKTLR